MTGDISNLLDKQHCEKLAVCFELKPAENDAIQTDANPGKMLMKILDERELIMPDKMIGLYEGLKAIHLNKVARLVLKYIDTSKGKNETGSKEEQDDMKKMKETQVVISKREVKVTGNAKLLIEEGYKRLDVQRALKLSYGKLNLGRRVLLFVKEEHERLPLFPGSNLYKEQYIDQHGGDMVIAGINLVVPAGALHTGRIINLRISTDPDIAAPVTDKSLRLTPFVKFGPENLHLEKPVTILIPHCASISSDQTGLDVYSGELRSDKTVKWSLEKRDISCTMDRHHLEVEAQKPCLIGLHVPYKHENKMRKRICVIPIMNRISSTGENFTISLWFYNDDKLEHKSLINQEVYQQRGITLHDPVLVILKSTVSTLPVNITSTTSQCSPHPRKVDVNMNTLWLQNRHNVVFHLQNKGTQDTVNLEIESRYGVTRKILFQLNITFKIHNLQHMDQIPSPVQHIPHESITRAFNQLKENLSAHLDADQSTQLASIFQLPQDAIKKHRTSGTLLLATLADRLLISPVNIATLENALTEQGNDECAKLVRDFRKTNPVVQATMCPEENI